MFTRPLTTSLRTSARTYATSAAPKSSSAPYFLGAGLVGAGLFYYSTLGQKDELKKGKVASLPSALSGDEFRNFKLAKIEKVNHNTSTYTFDLPAGTSAALPVASALVVKGAKEGEALGKNGKPVIRPYTPITAPDVEGKLELMIKHYPGGVIGDHLAGLKEGDELSIKGPIPKFAYKANEFDKVVLIAGGSGITPMWQIMQHIAADKSDKTNVHLVFSNVTEEDILLRKEFETLAKGDKRFTNTFVLDKPPKNWEGESGYINAELLKKIIPAAGSDKFKIFVCGPPGQVKAISGPKASMKDQGEVTGVLGELGYKPENVFKF